MAERPMLEVRALTKHFPARDRGRGQVHAVDGVSFSISRGETLGLVGESGCGKSTCARTVVRIYSPTSGTIFLDGDDITSLNPRDLFPLRRKMQMIFQDPYTSLNPRMTVRDLVAEPLAAHRSAFSGVPAEELIRDMIEKVGLSKEHLGRYPHEFSGGQRQRVGIARALILRPQLLICDEPISALDVSIQAQIVNMLRDFQEERGLTYLFIAHDLSMVRYVSNRVGVMYLGKLVELASVGEIYRHPMHPYTQGLLDSVPIPNPRLARLRLSDSMKGDLPSSIHPPSGCRFHTRCPKVMDRCSVTEPELIEVAPGHWLACHLHR